MFCAAPRPFIRIPNPASGIPGIGIGNAGGCDRKTSRVGTLQLQIRKLGIPT